MGFHVSLGECIGLGSASGPEFSEGPRNGRGRLEPEPF